MAIDSLDNTEKDVSVTGSATSDSTTSASVDFSTLILSLASSVYVYLGIAPGPDGKKLPKDLGLARHNIELLKLLKDKTRGNLSVEETQLIEAAVADLQLRFVQESGR